MIATGHDDLDELYSELKETHPRLSEEAFEYWGKRMYHQAKSYLLELKYGKHINKHIMNDSLNVLSQFLGVELPLWSIEDLKILLNNMGYNLIGNEKDEIDGKKYNIYDVNFISQKEKVIHKSLGSDPKKFIMLALESLDMDCEYAYDTYMRMLENYETK